MFEDNGRCYSLIDRNLDEIVCDPQIHDYLESAAARSAIASPPSKDELLAPIGRQEVWAAGVTYFRSRIARMQESEEAGGSGFYDRVYSAERPELFFKALPHKVVGPGGELSVRSDARWSVPEPELALLINPSGQIVGYTIGNDMSSRDSWGWFLLTGTRIVPPDSFNLEPGDTIRIVIEGIGVLENQVATLA